MAAVGISMGVFSGPDLGNEGSRRREGRDWA